MAENEFNLESILTKIIEAITASAVELAEEFTDKKWDNAPYIYQIPKYSVAVNMSLSCKDGKIKAIFTKSQEKTATSSIGFDVVATPPPVKENRHTTAIGTVAEFKNYDNDAFGFCRRYDVDFSDGRKVELFTRDKKLLIQKGSAWAFTYHKEGIKRVIEKVEPVTK